MSQRLRILYVAYPLLPVSRESCGGAEQMLWTVESEMARRGHDTVVAACEGSQVAGRLFATGAAPSEPDRFEQRDAEHAARILDFLAREPFEIVHDKSGSFWRHVAEVNGPMLATLHLPRSFYPAVDFEHVPPSLAFNCVSESQRRTFADVPGIAGVVQNGIRVEDFPLSASRRGEYLLWLGRICEEKGTHIAIDVARQAGRRLIIAGGVYPFSYHQQYFDREIRPHIDGSAVRFVETPSFDAKVDLLRNAHALLLSSLVAETSSLAAMEAMACGTPVVAFGRGAIPEIVREGLTGFIVDSAEEMAAAVARVRGIDALACRAHVEANFTATRMAADYERLYSRITREHSVKENSTAA